jgi:AmiR/NasT family two-component response regulator
MRASEKTPDSRRIRILVAAEGTAHLDLLADAVAPLEPAHIVRVGRVDEAARAAVHHKVAEALVGLPEGASSEHALRLIGQLVTSGACPVVVVTRTRDVRFLADAASSGIYAHVTELEPLALRTAIDFARQRFAEHARARQAMTKGIVIERAKGIIMERYGVEERTSFEMLSRETRNANLTLVDAAERIVNSHRLLPSTATRARRRRRRSSNGSNGAVVVLVGALASAAELANELFPSLSGYAG